MSQQPQSEGIGLDLGVKIAATLGDLTHALKENTEERRARRREAQKIQDPLNRDVMTTVTGATGSGDLTGPERGRRWVVRRFSLVRSDTMAAEAGTIADLFLASNVNNVQNSQFVARITGAPGFVLFSSESFVVIPHDRLVVQLSGATAGKFYIAKVALIDEDEASNATNSIDF